MLEGVAMEYLPNNPQFGECHGLCQSGLDGDCCQQDPVPSCCPDDLQVLDTLPLQDREDPDVWEEDMGSFSLPPLELDPLPSLFPFSPCSGYNRPNGGECRERGGDAADVLLSLKHAVVHDADPVHQQMMMNNSGYGYYDHYGGVFPTMSVNVSMNMTMHGCAPDQLCPQVQWNQNSSPSVNVVYPQSQNMINPSAYPSATYSFTADFRPPQSDPLITASSTFKPIHLQNSQKPNMNYGIFQKQYGQYSPHQKIKRPQSRVVMPEVQKEQNGYFQSQYQDYDYGNCEDSPGKVQVGSLSNCSEDDDQKPNLCRICGKTYARPSTLKTHLRTHSGERPYRCPDCHKSFSQAANLTAHVRTHTGQKPFRCPICDRRFSQSSSVTTHMRTHSGERPYQCRDCKKAFSDSSTLTKHARIHSGEKPYQCKLCLLRFSQSGNLNRHMRVHGNMSSGMLG